MKGIVIFKEANKNSKSEGVFPYLYVGEGKFVKIRLQNANPFENDELTKYDSKFVVVEGEYNDNNTFIVSYICEEKEEVKVVSERAKKEVVEQEVEAEPETVEEKEEGEVIEIVEEEKEESKEETKE